MKRKNEGATALRFLLVLMLAAITFCFGPVHAANIAAVDPLPSLDAQVDKPAAVAVDGQGKIYVAESLSDRVTIFSQSGNLLAEIPGLAKPISLAVDATGRIFIGSALKGSVTVFDSGLQELFKFGKGDGEFIQPADIDIDGSGQVFVVDKENNTIRVYSPSGQLLKSIGTPGNGYGQLHHPTSLAIDSTASELVVLDLQQTPDSGSTSLIDGARLQFFSMDGAFLRGYSKFGYDMNAGQLVKPMQVSVDGESRVYVTDSRLLKVMVYTNSNTFLGMIDNSETPLRTPLGLAMSATGRLYVTAMLGGRVNVFGIGDYSAMGVLPAALVFTATEGGERPVSQDATITNIGKGPLAWSAATGTPWLSLPAAAGTLQPAASGAVVVSVQPEGLSPGIYQGSVKVTAPGMAEEVAVTLTVRPNPLRVNPGSISFTSTAGTTPASQSLTIVNDGTEHLNWSATGNPGWLILNRSDGVAPDSLKVYADTAGLAPGIYTATIKVNNLSNGGSVSVPVALTINESQQALPIQVPGLPLPGKSEVKAGGKYWRMTQPVPGAALRGAWGSGHKDILAVGDSGTILVYDGKQWTVKPSGTGSTLHSVWGSAADDVYSVGSDGLALHSDGTAWTQVDPGTEETMLDVWGTAGTNVLAADLYGTILYDTFTAAYSSGVALRSIWGSSAADIFAAGESGAVLHFDGAAWTPVASGTSQWLNAVWGSSATDVFAVGENGTIVHYDGTAWSVMESGISGTLHGIYGNGPDDVYAVGDNGAVLHYDGTIWQVILAGGVNLRDVWTSGQLVVAVGDDGMILTARADGFPWVIIHRNIAIIGEQQMRKLEKDAKDKNKETMNLQGPAFKRPEIR